MSDLDKYKVKPKAIANVVATVSNQLHSKEPLQTTTREWLTPELLKTTLKLRAMMAKKYGARWTKREGESMLNGQPSDNFKLWADDIQNLTTGQLNRGWEVNSEMYEAAVLDGQTHFPPQSVDFEILCRKPTKSKLAPAEGANPEAYRVVKRKGIEDITGKEAQAAKNKVNAQKMLASLRGKGDVRL